MVPLQTGVNAVGKGIYTELRDYSMLKDALAENERMKEEIARLTEENNRLLAGQFELDRLRELYQLDQTYMQYEKIGGEDHCQGFRRLVPGIPGKQRICRRGGGR